MTRLATFSLTATLSVLIASQLSAQATADPYCAFEILVRSPDGAPLAHIPVAARRDGITFEANTETDARGIARICDSPLDSSIDIHVGENKCSVTVHSVYPIWRETRSIFVTLQTCRTREMLGYCHLLLRVRDEENRPLPNVRLDVADTSGDVQGTTSSDEFGRIFTAISWRTTSHGMLERPGYSKTPIVLECNPETSTSEKVITLKP